MRDEIIMAVSRGELSQAVKGKREGGREGREREKKRKEEI